MFARENRWHSISPGAKHRNASDVVDQSSPDWGGALQHHAGRPASLVEKVVGNDSVGAQLTVPKHRTTSLANAFYVKLALFENWMTRNCHVSGFGRAKPRTQAGKEDSMIAFAPALNQLQNAPSRKLRRAQTNRPELARLQMGR